MTVVIQSAVLQCLVSLDNTDLLDILYQKGIEQDSCSIDWLKLNWKETLDFPGKIQFLEAA